MRVVADEVAQVGAGRHEEGVDLVRAGFATRRKTLRNTLQGRVDAERFVRANIDPQARAETLSLADWARLANA